MLLLLLLLPRSALSWLCFVLAPAVGADAAADDQDEENATAPRALLLLLLPHARGRVEPSADDRRPIAGSAPDSSAASGAKAPIRLDP